MYDIVSSPNHIFVSCQHTRLSKLANVIDFKAHFPVVSIIFRLLFFFYKVGKTVWKGMTVYWWIRIRFSCALRRYDSEVFDGDFLPSKNEGKDRYVQRKKCHRSGYFSHIENFSCEQCNVPFWITLMACSPHADHWGNSHHILESSKVSITKEYVQFFLKTIGIGP